MRGDVAFGPRVERFDGDVHGPGVHARREDRERRRRQRLLHERLEADVVPRAHDRPLGDADRVRRLIGESHHAGRLHLFAARTGRRAVEAGGNVPSQRECADVRVVRTGAQVVLERTERLRNGRDEDGGGRRDDREQDAERRDQARGDGDRTQPRRRLRLRGGDRGAAHRAEVLRRVELHALERDDARERRHVHGRGERSRARVWRHDRDAPRPRCATQHLEEDRAAQHRRAGGDAEHDLVRT